MDARRTEPLTAIESHACVLSRPQLSPGGFSGEARALASSFACLGRLSDPRSPNYLHGELGQSVVAPFRFAYK